MSGPIEIELDNMQFDALRTKQISYAITEDKGFQKGDVVYIASKQEWEGRKYTITFVHNLLQYGTRPYAAVLLSLKEK